MYSLEKTMAKKQYVYTGVRITTEQKAKLEELTRLLDTSANAVMGMLIDNAVIEPVQKFGLKAGTFKVQKRGSVL